MRAIFYKVNPVGWATCKWLGCFWPGCRTTALNGFSLREVPPPTLPGENWVRLRTRLGGICGSDLALVAQKQPAATILQAFSSQPMILGHENVATVDEVGRDVDPSWVRRRVVVEPTLSCAPRGAAPPCERCAAGEFGACENFSGDFGGSAGLPPGTSIGYNARTGGSWGEFFVAHESQLVAVHDDLPDETALLIDPLACSLHAVLQASLVGVRRVLVYGTGMQGLGVIGSLRAVGFDGHIDGLGRSGRLADLTRSMGASDYFWLPKANRGRFERIADRTDGKVQRARFGNTMLSGGYDLVFDCVGSARSASECLKWTRARGQVVLLGTVQTARVDLTPVWFRELRIVGAYGRQRETFDGREISTYELVQEFLVAGTLKANGLLTHRFRIDEYRQALRVATDKNKHHSLKVAFDFR